MLLAARLRHAVERIAASPNRARLPAFERSISPLLRASSVVYAAAVRWRRKLYEARVFQASRLPVPVISVGNVTWGGNGKTPMAEFLAWSFVLAGINPIILTRGYGGGDEARMLEKHFEGTPVRVGVGADRVKVAASILEQCGILCDEKRTALAEFIEFEGKISRSPCGNLDVGVAILDDGMQHLRIARNVEIVMVNAVTMFGNQRMIPAGPLREPLDSLERAHVIVVHHANLVTEERRQAIISFLESNLWTSQPIIVLSEMTPSHFLSLSQEKALPLTSINDAIVLCMSGVGCPDSLSLCLAQLGVAAIHRMDYKDHHIFQKEDMTAMENKISHLEKGTDKAVVAVTSEKDFWRCPLIWKNRNVLVLCSSLRFMNGPGVVDFKSFVANTMKSFKTS